MAKEYVVGVKTREMKRDGDKFWNLSVINHGFSMRAYTSLVQAKNELAEFVRQNNPKAKIYDENGKRYVGTKIGAIGIQIELSPENDLDDEVVEYYIKSREVSDWEVIEKYAEE